METCLNYTDTMEMFFSSTERRWINKIRKLHGEHPDEVTIIAQPETNDGCIYAKLPAEYLKISPPRHLNMPDEHRRRSAEWLRNWHKEKALSACSETSDDAAGRDAV